MDVQMFKQIANIAVDYIVKYQTTLPLRPVLSDVKPGYLRKLIPSEAPETGEDWKELFQDFDKLIVPGLTHWQSPNYYAHFPLAGSYPSAIADILSTGMGIISFNWMTGPAITELEVIMMDWLGKLLDLPKEFLNCSEGPGGGIIKGTASEATLICLLATKDNMVKKWQKHNPKLTQAEIMGKLVAYTSVESNSSVEKSGVFAAVPFKLIPVDEDGAMDPCILRETIESDLGKGLIPCFCVPTLGTTGTCAFDNLEEIGPICEDYGIWMHVDAAYAGASFACPEYRCLKKGLEYADSFVFNPHKSLLIHFDCSCLWVKNANHLTDAFNVERSYLQHEHINDAPEYLHWGIPLGRRFRSLKIWFTLRIYGVEGVRQEVRKHMKLAKHLTNLIKQDDTFDFYKTSLGMVMFRIKGCDVINKEFLELVNSKRHLFLSSYTFNGLLLLRMCMNDRASQEDVDEAFEYIKALAAPLVLSNQN